MLKLPRTIRLDPSDTFVFERAAVSGEWAVSGAFVFWNLDPASLGQKALILTNQTPFYGESGGQMGDTGKIVVKDAAGADSGVIDVHDVQKKLGELFVHV